MKVNSKECTILSAKKIEKKDKSGYYYTLSFLDENDAAYNCYIDERLYDDICRQTYMRFDLIDIEMSIYKDTKGQYQFRPTAVTVQHNPFVTSDAIKASAGQTAQKLKNEKAGN